MMVPLIEAHARHSFICLAARKDNNLFKLQGRLRRILNLLKSSYFQISAAIIAVKLSLPGSECAMRKALLHSLLSLHFRGSIVQMYLKVQVLSWKFVVQRLGHFLAQRASFCICRQKTRRPEEITSKAVRKYI